LGKSTEYRSAVPFKFGRDCEPTALIIPRPEAFHIAFLTFVIRNHLLLLDLVPVLSLENHRRLSRN
jgi:hypothetical protein